MLDESDLKIDVFRSTGANGAGKWAVRLTHLPSGIQLITEGDFASGDNPEPAITEAATDLRAKIEAKLEDS